MHKNKLSQSEAHVQGLLNAMRKLVEDKIQDLVESEFEKHMGRRPMSVVLVVLRTGTASRSEL